MGATNSTPLEGGDQCTQRHGKDKKGCQRDAGCHRVNHQCVRKAKPTSSPCAHRSKRECRRHPQCELADKECIRKAPRQMRQGYYRGHQVKIVRTSDKYPGHYVIEYADGAPYRATVRMAEVTASPPVSPSVGFSSTPPYSYDEVEQQIKRVLRQVQQHKVHDESQERPSCQPGPYGDFDCRQMGLGKCGSRQHPRRCNPEGRRKQQVIRRWKSAAAQKCEERCATQPEQTAVQADMKRRCYSNCRSRHQ